MSRRDPRVRLLHMRDYATKAIDLVKGHSRSALDSNEVLRLALTHLVELIGEAASQVPKNIMEKYPEIPWPQVIGMRHRLIHGYDFVDHDLLWSTLTSNLPVLVDSLNHILDEE